MSATAVSLWTIARDWRLEWRDRWLQASGKTRTKVQVAVLFTAVAVAYHYSLTTLLQSLNLDTPLAYVGLVPVIAAGLAVLRSRPRVHEPPIHDRQLDYIVGVPLLAAALSINLLLPRKLSAMFWVWRVDLLSLPLFVAGAAAVIFGVRATWRQRLAIGYLFLAWPVPYSLLLIRELTTFTGLTLGGLRTVLHLVHFATPVRSGDGSLFTVVHHGRPFSLSVVSACSGVNGMVGFLLVGVAFGAAVTGPRVRKMVWLLIGLVLIWAFNVGRLLLIFWTGQQFGEHFAIRVLHPFVGLVTFNIGILVMLLFLKPFGLRLGLPGAAPGLGAHHAEIQSPSRPVAVPTVYAAIALVAAIGLIVGITNTTLRSYDLVASATGEPKLASYLAYPASPAGWNASFLTEYTWAKPYFGESSTWYRYSYLRTLGNSDVQSTLPVTADVVNTNNLFSFSAYGIESCYRFHGYTLRNVGLVSLGGGITGQTLSYSTKSADWSVLYWVWPIKSGGSTRYERVILYMLDTANATISAPGLTGLSNVHGSLNLKDETQRRLIAVRAFLVAFGREVVKGQASVVQGSRLARPVPPIRRRRILGNHTVPTVVSATGSPVASTTP